MKTLAPIHCARNVRRLRAHIVYAASRMGPWAATQRILVSDGQRGACSPVWAIAVQRMGV